MKLLTDFRVTFDFNEHIEKGRPAGVDIGTPVQTPLYAYFLKDSGRATYMIDQYGGLFVDIVEGNRKWRLLHLDHKRFNIGTVKTIKKNDFIGYSGNTGWSYGPHTHVELWINGNRVNPMPELKKAANNKQTSYNAQIKNMENKTQIGNTNQYTSLSGIARDLFGRSDWGSKSAWDYVLSQGNRHLWTGNYDVILKGAPIYKLSSKPKKVEKPRVTIDDKKVKELEQKLKEEQKRAAKDLANAIAAKEEDIKELNQKIAELQGEVVNKQAEVQEKAVELHTYSQLNNELDKEVTKLKSQLESVTNVFSFVEFMDDEKLKEVTNEVKASLVQKSLIFISRKLKPLPKQFRYFLFYIFGGALTLAAELLLKQIADQSLRDYIPFVEGDMEVAVYGFTVYFGNVIADFFVDLGEELEQAANDI